MVRTWYQLPSEIVRISIEESKRYMALRAVDLKDAPQKLKSSFATTNQDVADVMNALSNPNTDPTKKTVAFIVDMADPGWTATKDGAAKYPKPENAFTYSLRRRFEALGLPLTAYQSGKMQITVRRKTTIELAPKKKK